MVTVTAWPGAKGACWTYSSVVADNFSHDPGMAGVIVGMGLELAIGFESATRIDALESTVEAFDGDASRTANFGKWLAPEAWLEEFLVAVTTAKAPAPMARTATITPAMIQGFFERGAVSALAGFFLAACAPAMHPC